MDYVTLTLAILALVLAFGARNRLHAQAYALEETQRDLRARCKLNAEEAREGDAVLREMMAQNADGQKLTGQQIREGRAWNDITTAEAKQLLEAGAAHVVDVRSGAETAGGVIPGALLIPIDDLEERLDEVPNDGRDVLVYCAGGGRSSAGCQLLSRHGYGKLHNLLGGMQGWDGAVERQG